MALSRRSFLRNTTAASAGAALSGGLVQSVLGATAPALTPGPGNKWPGRVAINFNKGAVTRNGTNATAVPTVIQKMVDDTILLLTGQTTVAAAWKSVFPASLTAQSKIAIKVNTLNSGSPAPHWSSVKAITDGLQQMDFSGTKFSAANITIYDMNNGGSNLNTAGFNATNFGSSVKIVTDTAVNGGDGASSNRTYAASLRDAQFLINVFSPRGHNIGSTFTLNFKSHFGTYSNPSGMHGNAATYFRDLNCAGPVFNKTCLCVCSGIFGMNEGNGPTGAANDYTNYAKTMDPTATLCPTTIMMSTDPVSIEQQAIKMMRLNKSPAGPYGTTDMPTYLRASAGITGALTGTTYNIGIMNETAMDIRRIINTTQITALKEHVSSDRYPGTGITASQTSGRSTFVEFALPDTNSGKNASIEITSIKGALVWKSSQNVMGTVNHFSWNQRNSAGDSVRPGIYVVRVISGATNMATKFTVAR